MPFRTGGSIGACIEFCESNIRQADFLILQKLGNDRIAVAEVSNDDTGIKQNALS